NRGKEYFQEFRLTSSPMEITGRDKSVCHGVALTFLATARKATKIFLAGSMAVIFVFGTRITANAKTVKVAIPAQNLTSIVFFAAQARGYCREEVLDVQLILMSPPVAPLAVIGGDIDFSTAAGGALNSAVRGAPIHFLFHTYSRGLYWIYTRPDIRDVTGL